MKSYIFWNGTINWKSIDIKEEYVAYIFSVEELAKQETSTKQVANRA
jgi:hypothetical protein